MAKRATSSSKSTSTPTTKAPVAGHPRDATAAKTSAVSNTAIPKVVSTPALGGQPPAKANGVTRDRIAQRAYEIFASGKPGTELDHWLQAERELRAK